MIPADAFPQSEKKSKTAVARFQAEKGLTGPVPNEWSISEHLLGFSSRLGTLRVLGRDLFLAAVKTFKALWPGEEHPKGPAELAERLMGSGARLHQWRESAARIAADDAMALVLSWYETIDFNLLKNLRTNGKYICK